MKKWLKRRWFLFKNWLYEKWARDFFKDRIGPVQYEMALLIAGQAQVNSVLPPEHQIDAAKRQIIRVFAETMEKQRLIEWHVGDRIDIPGAPKQVYGTACLLKARPQ